MSRKRVPVYDPATGAMTWGWQDEGPGYASTGHHRGELVVGISGPTRQNLSIVSMEREARRRATRTGVTPQAGPTCGFPMTRLAGFCARAAGHRGPHTSRQAMDHAAEKRRAAA